MAICFQLGDIDVSDGSADLPPLDRAAGAGHNNLREFDRALGQRQGDSHCVAAANRDGLRLRTVADPQGAKSLLSAGHFAQDEAAAFVRNGGAA